MEESNVQFFVKNQDGSTTEIKARCDKKLSVMEVLVENNYDILATCGGMALCGTCCVDILEGGEKLKEIEDEEYLMLETLPDVSANSRLSCQLSVNKAMNNLILKIH